MKQILIGLMLFFTVAAAQAQQLALTAGFRNNNADTDIAGALVEAQSGIYLGALAWFPLMSPLGFRTGFLYTQRFVDISYTNGNSTQVRFSYLDIPLTLVANFNEYAGVFAGPILAINQAKDCSSSVGGVCSAIEAKSSVVPITLGATFKFTPQMGGEFFYEFYSGELAKGLSNMKSLGANFVFFFE